MLDLVDAQLKASQGRHTQPEEMNNLCALAGACWVLSDEESTGDTCSLPGSGRAPGGGHGNPLQNSCLENPMDRGARWATVHDVTKSWTWLKRLSKHARSTLHGSSLFFRVEFVIQNGNYSTKSTQSRIHFSCCLKS